MNYRLITRILGAILVLEGLTMLPAMGISMLYGDGDAPAFALSFCLAVAAGIPGWAFSRPERRDLRLKEGFLTVALAWVLLSVVGALPYVLSGALPSFMDAFFETVSGLTTTGATIMTDIDSQMRGILFWRSFTHWIGGMGVLVLTLAILPSGIGRASHLMRAESPGPEFSKLLPKTGNSAQVLYIIYAIMTLVEFVLLMLAGLSPYDAAIHAMSTAGTGGFSNKGLSVGAYQSPAVDWIITIFMILFSINFALYYRMLMGHFRDALRSEELHWFLAILVGASLLITVNILPLYEDFGTAIRYGFFHVSSVMSTTGFALDDFNLWPQASKIIIFILMFIGSCAGSTGGGVKVVRIALMVKQSLMSVRRSFQPRRVTVIRFEGHGVDKDMLSQITVFFFTFVALALLGTLVISLQTPYDFETNFTAALTCVSNVGPGFGAVGPMGSFAGYSGLDKFILSVLMLAGRLEIFPILALFHPAIWRKVS